MRRTVTGLGRQSDESGARSFKHRSQQIIRPGGARSKSNRKVQRVRSPSLGMVKRYESH